MLESTVASSLFSTPYITAFLLGATALLVLINLGQAWVRRESLNLWMAVYVMALSVALLCLWQLTYPSNTSFSPLTRDQNPLSLQIYCKVLLVIAMIAQCRLVWRFASLPDTFQRWNRLFIGSNICLILLASVVSAISTTTSVVSTPTPLVSATLKFAFLFSSVLCLVHLLLLTREQEPNAVFLLIAKAVSLCAFGSAWWLTLMVTGRPVSHWLAQATVIIEGMLITYALVMNSVEHWQHRIRTHYERSLRLKLKQQYNTTLKLVDHELRTPLSGVVGIAELLLDTSLSKTQRDQVSTMRRASEALLKWLNRLNDWRALQIGRLHFDAIPFDFSQLLQTLFEDTRVKAEDRKIRLTYAPDTNIPTLIKGDPARLKQIISGTLEMALFYSEQGEVSIELNPMTERNRWQLVITDTQSGLQTEDIQIALDNQFELDAEHYSSVQRNWLIAKALVKHIDGTLIAELEDGHARFTCELQLTRYSLLQHHENQYDQLLHKKRLLVVDDSSSSRKLVAKRADSWGMTTTCVPAGKDAVAMINTMNQVGAGFDAIILDYDLPDITGLELARQINRNPRLKPTPVMIMLSGDNVFPYEEQARDLLIRRVLTKPISSQSLKITLAEELTLQEARNKTSSPDNPDTTESYTPAK
ncbi:response regulator [Pseudomaricurvus sp.]|uniref:response regulator n=1 Tax=Pseudomaricurvus sp. TaxID=2004510 RepID=UPI003F6A907E